MLQKLKKYSGSQTFVSLFFKKILRTPKRFVYVGFILIFIILETNINFKIFIISSGINKKSITYK